MTNLYWYLEPDHPIPFEDALYDAEPLPGDEETDPEVAAGWSEYTTTTAAMQNEAAMLAIGFAMMDQEDY